MFPMEPIEQFGFGVGTFTDLIQWILWIVAAVGSTSSFFMVRKLRRRHSAFCESVVSRYSSAFDGMEKVHSHNPAAVIINISPRSDTALPKAIEYFQGNPQLKTLADKQRIIQIPQPGTSEYELIGKGIELDKIKESMAAYWSLLLKTRLDLEAKNVSEIHLIINGPLMAAVIAGRVFDWVPVKLHQYDKNLGTYQYWGPLGWGGLR
jgi:hypothetical protein